jgi:hypothetical protein
VEITVRGFSFLMKTKDFISNCFAAQSKNENCLCRVFLLTNHVHHAASPQQPDVFAAPKNRQEAGTEVPEIHSRQI